MNRFYAIIACLCLVTLRLRLCNSLPVTMRETAFTAIPLPEPSAPSVASTPEPSVEALIPQPSDDAELLLPSPTPQIPFPVMIESSSSPTSSDLDFPRPSTPASIPSGATTIPDSDSGVTPTSAPACMPVDTPVKVRGRGVVPIQLVRVGDEVEVGVRDSGSGSGASVYSTVLLLTHYDADAVTVMRTLSLNDEVSVTLSGGHYVELQAYRRRILTAVRDVRIGDVLVSGQRVQNVTWTSAHGLYNLQTASGTFVVRGALVSAYTDGVRPTAAHALMAPLRALHRATGCTVPGLSLLFAPKPYRPREGIRHRHRQRYEPGVAPRARVPAGFGIGVSALHKLG